MIIQYDSIRFCLILLDGIYGMMADISVGIQLYYLYKYIHERMH
jgi:hypothetical protein